jgi:methylase of polypeptide subunit release factors
MSFLLAHELQGGRSSIDILCTDVDISQDAIALAKSNCLRLLDEEQTPTTLGKLGHAQEIHLQRHQFAQALKAMCFVHADIFSPTILKELESLGTVSSGSSLPRWDVLVSNPPYISHKDFNTITARSVRQYEPKIALVPPGSGNTSISFHSGDIFYPRLLELAEEAATKFLLLEVGDLPQALRVASMAIQWGTWKVIEIWRDEPSLTEEETISIRDADVKVKGQGNGRSVFCWRE